MENFDEFDEIQKELPPDYRASRRELEQVYRLFGEHNGIRPDIRILLGSYSRDKKREPDKNYPTLRIILDSRLCLFFYGNSGKWVFDGHECGNYEEYWTEFDWQPKKQK